MPESAATPDRVADAGPPGPATASPWAGPDTEDLEDAAAIRALVDGIVEQEHRTGRRFGRRRQGSGPARLVRDVVETLVLTVVIFLGAQTFVVQPFQVQQVSMQPNFESGEFVLVDKLTPNWDAFGRGDVVVFEPPEEWTIERTPFIKRVIGVAGDTVALVDGRVVLNGAVLEEPYAYRDEAGAVEPTDPEQAETSWTLADGQLFVMGDHRQASLDSRAFGPIRVGDVIGRVTVRYWPLAAFGFVVPPEYGLATGEEGT